MKDVQIDEPIRRDPKLLEVVEKATELLEDVIGASAQEITARWSIHAQMSDRIVGLEISDGMSNASVGTTESGLRLIVQSKLRSTFNWLWGDLLQERSHQQMAKLKIVMQSLGQD